MPLQRVSIRSTGFHHHFQTLRLHVLEQMRSQFSGLLRMHPFERLDHRQVHPHQHTEKVVLGHIDAKDDPLACRPGTDPLPLGVLDILGAVLMVA